MQNSKEKLLQELETFATFPFGNLFFSHPVASVSPMNFRPRIVIVKKGSPFFQIVKDKESLNIRATAGDAVCCLAGSPSITQGRMRDYETFTLCFYPDFIRAAIYRFSSSDSIPDLTYIHTALPLIPAGKNILEALNQIANAPELKPCGLSLIQTLLQMVKIMIQNEGNKKNIGKSEYSWLMIVNYLEHNLDKDLRRKKIAEEFLMNQNYLTALCLRHTKMGYNEYVCRLRLSQAQILLELNLTIDEIAQQCGFHYTSHFIRLFKKHYGTSPGKFRLP